MVNSLLSPGLNYEETRSLLPEDKNQETFLYEITLFGKDEFIALGQPVYTFVEKNIIYYPIYLVKNDKVTMQIGLYEIFAENVVNILDADGDVDLSLIGQPLLYGFAREAGTENIAETIAKETIAAETIAEEKLLKEQTAEQAEKERSLYVAAKENHWIQAYMKNNNYRMIENEGKGDCLFAVIRDALAKVGVYKSVDDMRKILAANVTEDLYNGYKTVYDDAAVTDAQLLKELKTLANRHKVLKTQITVLKDRNAKQSVIAQADEIKRRHDEVKRERAYTKSVVEGELQMMAKVHNLTQFKALVQTCSYWGDTWAISTLERVLNIKLILFSEESFKAGDIDNVLTCGQLNDTVLEEKGIFQPDYYILTLYQGYHYQLISYKDKGALTFIELPYDVKMKVVDKCLERLAGPYYIIPEFREFMEESKSGLVSETKSGLVAATTKTMEPAKTMEPTSIEPMQSDLFNNATVFQFYIKSVDKQPGKGTGEILAESEKNDYKDLQNIPDWRRKLSNLWPAAFTLDGRRWQSVEHYYEGSKYKRGNSEFYLQFSLDSGSDMSKDPAMAKGYDKKYLRLCSSKGKDKGKDKDKNSDKGKDKNSDICDALSSLKLDDKSKTIMIDEDFFGASANASARDASASARDASASKRDASASARGAKEMEAAQYAKFSQHEDLKELLKATKKAKLQHFERGAEPVVYYELMAVRRTFGKSAAKPNLLPKG